MAKNFKIPDLKPAESKVFNRVYNQYYKHLVMFINRRISNLEVAEEISVDVFIKSLYTDIYSQEESNIKSFLFTCALNDVRNYFKAYNREKPVIRSLNPDFDPACAQDIEFEIMSTNVIKILYETSSRLPKKCGKVFRLINYEFLTTEEVAAEMGISTTTVRNQHNRALALMRRFLNVEPAPARPKRYVFTDEVISRLNELRGRMTLKKACGTLGVKYDSYYNKRS